MGDPVCKDGKRIEDIFRLANIFPVTLRYLSICTDFRGHLLISTDVRSRMLEKKNHQKKFPLIVCSRHKGAGTPQYTWQPITHMELEFAQFSYHPFEFSSSCPQPRLVSANFGIFSSELPSEKWY